MTKDYKKFLTPEGYGERMNLAYKCVFSVDPPEPWDDDEYNNVIDIESVFEILDSPNTNPLRNYDINQLCSCFMALFIAGYEPDTYSLLGFLKLQNTTNGFSN